MTTNTPEQMRVLSDRAEMLQEDSDYDYVFVTGVMTALRAAADEVDRLRARVAWFDRYTPLGVSPEWITAVAKDNDRLWAVIKNAPHADWCPQERDRREGAGTLRACLCWKADVL